MNLPIPTTLSTDHIRSLVTLLFLLPLCRQLVDDVLGILMRLSNVLCVTSPRKDLIFVVFELDRGKGHCFTNCISHINMISLLMLHTG